MSSIVITENYKLHLWRDFFFYCLNQEEKESWVEENVFHSSFSIHFSILHFFIFFLGSNVAVPLPVLIPAGKVLGAGGLENTLTCF